MQCTFGWDMICSPKEFSFIRRHCIFFTLKRNAHSSDAMALLHQTACCLHLGDTIPPYIILLLRKNNGTVEGCLTVIKFRGRGITSYANSIWSLFQMTSDNPVQCMSKVIPAMGTQHTTITSMKIYQVLLANPSTFQNSRCVIPEWLLAASTLKSRFEYWLMLTSLQTENLPIINHVQFFRNKTNFRLIRICSQRKPNELPNHIKAPYFLTKSTSSHQDHFLLNVTVTIFYRPTKFQAMPHKIKKWGSACA